MLLLEATLDDEALGAIDGTGGTQFGEQELSHCMSQYIVRTAEEDYAPCSSVRFMRLQISEMFAKMVFLLPSRRHWGGGIL